MPFAKLTGVNLYYEVHGAGPTIVFAHGAGGSHLNWYQQVAELSSEFRCVTFDHRSYGQSVDESGEGWLAYERDLEGLLNYLEIPETFLVAQSMGGYTCFPFAAHHPDRVRKLIMADTALGVDLELLEQMRRNRDQRSADLGIGGFTREYKETQRASYLLYQQIAALNQEPAQPPPSEAVVIADLKDYRVPTLFMVGSADYLATPELIRKAHALVPGSQFVEVQGPGHSVYWEQPQVFNHILRSFFMGEA